MSRPSTHQTRAFTLVEMLVVMVIIGLLMALLLPAVQAARENARLLTCRSNLRQIAIAVISHEAARGVYPSGSQATAPDANGNINSWSTLALLLPYLEQKTTSSKIDYSLSYEVAADITTADGKTTKISALRVPTYRCPSDSFDEPRLVDGVATHYPINYGMNMGVWFVWNPATGKGGEGAFYPGSRLMQGSFPDGAGTTLCAAEVKGWTPYFRNAALDDPAIDSNVSTLGKEKRQFKTNSGHTEWVDARVHQTGFTSFFTPNTKVLSTVGGVTYDVDWTNQQEGKSATVSTFAAVTSRSYHSSAVNVSMMDGSARPINETISLGVWRALSTRRGEEILPNNYGE